MRICALILLITLFYSCNMNVSKEIKKEIRFDSLFIRLYKTTKNVDIGNESVANIQAFDCQGKLIWTVEPPTFNFSYFDIQIDESLGILEADSGAGRVYKINLENGRIISSEIIK